MKCYFFFFVDSGTNLLIRTLGRNFQVRIQGVNVIVCIYQVQNFPFLQLSIWWAEELHKVGRPL